jgi:hypothetical protein
MESRYNFEYLYVIHNSELLLETLSKDILWPLADFSPQRPRSSTKEVHVAFVVNKVTLIYIILRAFQHSLDNYHSTNSPVSHPSSGAGKMSLLVTQVPRESPYRKTK